MLLLKFKIADLEDAFKLFMMDVTLEIGHIKQKKSGTINQLKISNKNVNIR